MLFACASRSRLAFFSVSRFFEAMVSPNVSGNAARSYGLRGGPHSVSLVPHTQLTPSKSGIVGMPLESMMTSNVAAAGSAA